MAVEMAEDGKLGTRLALVHICSERTIEQKLNESVKTYKVMKNMKYMAILAGVAFAATALVPQAQANPVVGTIAMGGSATLNTGNANTASSVTAWGNPTAVTVTSDSGSFLSVGDGSAVTIVAPWTFNSGAVANFWSVGGFTFSLTSSAIFSQGGGGVLVDGTGTISGNGFSTTAGTWSFSAQNPPGTGDSFSFSASTGSVPDGGLTLALLGSALVGLQVLRRKLAC